MPKQKPQRIAIIFDDEQIIVVNKPARMLSVPDRYNHDIPNVYHYLQHKYGEVFIVHRLDRETSGIIVFAKNAEAHKHLSKQFLNHTVEKIYHTIILGLISPKEGIIELPIIENPARRGTMMVHKSLGKLSETQYQVMEEFAHYAYVRVRLKTGRMHQIRVHFQAIGYPLAIDDIYGKQVAFYLSSVKHKYHTAKHEDERPIMSRLSLHAHTLGLIHPTTEETMEFNAELPKDFSVMLKQLRKYDVKTIM
jgi:23S rRNA pseudouridine1911/1915/1917 synthase